jgi:hypothetical protein
MGGIETSSRTSESQPPESFGRLILGATAVGAIVFGLGSRLVMRVIGFVASPEHAGELTAFGIVGRVTFAGVVGLVIFGSIAGLFTGFLYMAARPWLPSNGVVRALAFSLFLLVPIGMITIASSKADFVLVSSTLILAMFAGMVVVDGLATVWAIERLGRDSLEPPHPRPLGYMVMGAITLIGSALLAGSVSSIL